jgi:hypothetical protein
MTNPTNATQPAAAAEATTTGERKSGSGVTGFPNERRKRNIPVATDRRRAENAAAKRKSSERRRLIDPTTCERDYSDDETEFMKAMDRYKRENRRPFPTWSEVLEVLRSLGYRRVAEPTDLPGRGSGVVAVPGTTTPPPAQAGAVTTTPPPVSAGTGVVPQPTDKRAPK